jgi:hypothetical protein
MGDPRYAYQLGHIVDDVHHAPVTDAKTPLILIALKLFASRAPWLLPERIHFANYARQYIVRHSIEFFPGGKLYLDDLVIHEGGRV